MCTVEVFLLTTERHKMGKFILGIVCTLAVLYPAVTKAYFSKAVDTTHHVVTGAIENAK
jgi:hypothetical protein